MERWNDGVMEQARASNPSLHHSITPSLHHSITPSPPPRSVLPREGKEHRIDVPLVALAQPVDHEAADGDEELERGGGEDAGQRGDGRLRNREEHALLERFH